MPHLQFDISFKVKDKTKQEFLETVETIFCNIMKTGRSHIAISLRELNRDSISLGRAKINENICLMNLDIRKGRTQKQKRDLVVEYINLVNFTFGINFSPLSYSFPTPTLFSSISISISKFSIFENTLDCCNE